MRRGGATRGWARRDEAWRDGGRAEWRAQGRTFIFDSQGKTTKFLDISADAGPDPTPFQTCQRIYLWLLCCSNITTGPIAILNQFFASKNENPPINFAPKNEKGGGSVVKDELRALNVGVVVDLVAAVEECESSLFTEEELEEVGRVVRRDRVGLVGRVVFEAGF